MHDLLEHLRTRLTTAHSPERSPRTGYTTKEPGTSAVAPVASRQGAPDMPPDMSPEAPDGACTGCGCQNQGGPERSLTSAEAMPPLASAPDDGITADEALLLASLPPQYALDILATAQAVRSSRRGGPARICGIVNAKSGRCPEDCAFCAQSRHHHSGSPVHPLVDEEHLVRRAGQLRASGAERYGIVTSGTRLSPRELEKICNAAHRIRREVGIALCGSFGQLTPDYATSLREAGFSSYHHNLETSRSFFPGICTTHDYDDDIETVRRARDAGLRTCCGGILGMGESDAQRIELSMTLRELAVDSIPLNFLNPIPGTRLQDRGTMPPMRALVCIALFRLMHPGRDILVCGGREATLGEWQSWIFLAGANGVMIGNYLTTTGRDMADDIAMLHTLGVHA